MDRYPKKRNLFTGAFYFSGRRDPVANQAGTSLAGQGLFPWELEYL